MLTVELLKSMNKLGRPEFQKVYFIGGVSSDYATGQRVSALKDVVKEACGSVSDDQIFANSYDPNGSTVDAETICNINGGLLAGLFVNSTFAFEGVLRYFASLRKDDFSDISVGCCDYDPFASFMHFPVIMVCQNVNKMMAEAFIQLENGPSMPDIRKNPPNTYPAANNAKKPLICHAIRYFQKQPVTNWEMQNNIAGFAAPKVRKHYQLVLLLLRPRG